MTTTVASINVMAILVFMNNDVSLLEIKRLTLLTPVEY
ncbi:hypothetical protein [Methylomonas albis]|nr:hypothetical protein [Methylomonas albis]